MRLFGQKKTGFLTRLGNIIIIQVLFVFAALAIVLFYPDSEKSVNSEHLLRYTFFILFLASGLVSLLTVNLIRKRFQRPLDRLIGGFEKTRKGELYCLIESDVDDELSKLTQAYNGMSLTLWDNHKQLSDNNARLAEANVMLRESQEFLGTLIDSSPTCIISTSPDGEIMLFNREASRVFAIDRETAVGMEFDQLFTNRMSEIKTSKLVIPDKRSVEVLCRRGDGSLFPAYMISVPVNTKGNDVWAYLHLIKDISESKNFQEMMIRLDRYYTRGEMAGDIAHEINNFLAILSGNVELMPLLMKRSDSEKIDQKLQVMKTTIDRITQFTDGLLDAGGEKVRFEQADINQLIQTVIAFLKPQNRFDNLTIKTNLSTDIPLVDIDTGQMQQLMVNLLRNASEALESSQGDRSITVSTVLVDIGGQQGTEIEVRDSGPGVQPDKRELLFEKRFTTKVRGHGIGLVTCKRIVDNHTGRIAYNFDSGAVFKVTLPVKNQTAADPQETPVAACAENVS